MNASTILGPVLFLGLLGTAILFCLEARKRQMRATHNPGWSGQGKMSVPAARHEKIRALEASLRRVEAISLPRLQRPDVGCDMPATPELVAWAIRLYVFSLVSHLRELLHSFLLLLREGHIPGTLVIGRSLFELGAHACLVKRKMAKHLEAEDHELAWRLLRRINMGNRYMLGHRDHRPGDPEWGAPFHVLEAIRALDESLKDTAKEEKAAEKMYSRLSEHCHPNMGAFSLYYRFDEDETGVSVRFDSQPEQQVPPPIPEVNVALASSLSSTVTLLERAGDTEIAGQLGQILDGLIAGPGVQGSSPQ